MKSISAKASLRILRFLKQVSVAESTPFRTDKGQNILLTGDAGKKMLVSPTAMDALHRAALISLDDGHCSLTKTGARKLKRIEHGGNDFMAQHRDQDVAEMHLDGAAITVAVNHNESILTRLRRRKAANGQTWLDDDHVDAGERLRRDFTLGQLMQKVTSSWDAAIGTSKSGRGGKADLSDNAIDARDRMEKALQAVGPDLASVLTDVCCFLKGLECVERERRWPPRSAKLMLRTGLDLLSRHYGTKSGSSKSVPTRHWGTADFRPSI